ncbi:Retinol dehydrogenase 12 [Haplosporangium bisporale]|nr:Retinol dehydrogenase 12 [Haplosporangium bisporale]
MSSDLTKVYQSAQTFLKEGLPLHILINNSGVAWSPVKQSADGLEYMFTVNHLGHFVFTLALLDRIKESQPSRVVT